MAHRQSSGTRRATRKNASPLLKGPFFIGVRHREDWLNRWQTLFADMANPPKTIHLPKGRE